MLRTARMVRLAILAPHTRERDVIEVLHAARTFHLEEYTEGEHPDLDLGKPLEDASPASERLVRIRALLRHLGLTGEEAPNTTFDPSEVRSKLDQALVTLENNVGSAIESRDRIARELEDRVEQRGRLLPLVGLGLDVDDLSGYDSARVFLGEADPDVTRAVSSVTSKAAVFRGPDAQAVVAPAADADRVQEVLADAGFNELEAPEGSGSVEANLRRLTDEIASLRSKIESARAELDKLRNEYGDFLLAAEEDLSIDVEKAEAPLAFGHTERAFVIDAWVPAETADDLTARLQRATDGAVHVEVLDEGMRDVHHRTEEPPTKYEHSGPMKPFGFFLDLFSRPKYDEIDPTLILFIVFPLFFGFMIGDIGYGILMTGLGALMMVKLGGRSGAANGLGAGLFLAGVWATLFGLVVFHDAFGIPFVTHADNGLSWFLLDDHGHVTGRGLLGMTFTEESWLANPIIEKLASHEAHTFAELGDPFGPSEEFLGVKAMLALSIVAAFVHLLIGFVFGFVNHVRHSSKHAMAQVGWILVLVAFYVVIQAKMPENAVSHWSNGLIGVADGAIPLWSLGALGVGILVLVITEGAIGAFETLGLLAHTISYTRLAGVGVAKAAMAGAFNGLFLADMVLDGSGAILVVGLVLFIVAQLLVLVLGILSSGIQAIRLNYVEFFLKFFQGGGEEFSPFGRERKYSQPTPKTT